MKINMEYFCAQLHDLPVEILLKIFKQLSNVEILYSLWGVNQRLSTIVHDPLFTSHLIFTNHYSNSFLSASPISMFDRFLFEIFPKIHDQVQWLDLTAPFIERILLFPTFPNLYGLGLLNLEIEYAKRLFIDETSLIHKFKNQILALSIDISQIHREKSMKHAIKLLFTQILTEFTNLQYLNICSYSIDYQELNMNLSSATVISSTLAELYVYLEDINDCLCLLDGRFNQLRILNVKIHFISLPSTINIKKNLINLRCFSLHCDNNTKAYDRSVVPLLQQMLNLEKLNLYLSIEGNERLVDGNELEKNIVNHMAQLKQFTFYIRSSMRLSNGNYSPSNEYIQSTLTRFQKYRIVCYTETFSIAKIGKCHLFTCPYQLDYYDKISTHFPGGLFQCVRHVSLYDERPFEHEFFLRIQQSFPMMEKLTLDNSRAQKKKLLNQSLPIIKYSHLIVLDFFQAHDDYLEEFLLDTKTCLMNNIQLLMDYRALKRVTRRFTRRGTRTNCFKIIFPYENYLTQLPKHYKTYFNL